MRTSTQSQAGAGKVQTDSNLGISRVPDLVVPSQNPRMQLAEERVVQIGAMDLPVLIVGEVGTGRQLFARWIHQASPQRHQPMFSLCCSDTRPETLAEAVRKLEQAKGGILFLHEIADLDSLAQLKAFALLQGQEEAAAGQVRAPIRLIASTARFDELTAPESQFRPELFYRVSSLLLRLPPLRERKEDIGRLVEFFQRRYAAAFQRNHFKPLSRAGLRSLRRYDWPGNVRELENLVKRLVLFGPSALEEVEFLTRGNGKAQPEPEAVAVDEETTPPLKEVARAAAQRAEKELIMSVLDRTRWNRRQTARDLAISYKTLLYKLKQLGLGKDNGSGGNSERISSASFPTDAEKHHA